MVPTARQEPVVLEALAALLARAVLAVLLILLLAAALVRAGRQMADPQQPTGQARRAEQAAAPTEAPEEQLLRLLATAALTPAAAGNSHWVRS